MSVTEQARRARDAAYLLARATRAAKDDGLHAMADALAKAETDVLEANEGDVSRAKDAGTAAAMVDRLRLDPDRVAAMVAGLRALAGLADPVGDVVRGWTTAHGRPDPPGAGPVRGGGDHL